VVYCRGTRVPTNCFSSDKILIKTQKKGGEKKKKLGLRKGGEKFKDHEEVREAW